MTLPSNPCRHCAATALILLVCASGALAASPSALTEAQARYRQEMTVCNSGQSNQDQATCRLEAKNALAEAKRGTLNDAPGQYRQNALQRCNAHQGDDLRACQARMMVPEGAAGSSADGGILRESVTISPIK